MTKKALCVGINKFKHLPGAALRGCVNDALDMRDMLRDVLGFAASDITVLTDAQATKAGIIAKLTGLVEEAKAGKIDYLVLSLSSHGTQVPDTDGEESDNSDEAFCPHDLKAKGNQWDPKRIITDDELNTLFAQLPDNVLLEVFLDTCHSGTGLKDIDPLTLLIPDAPKPRYLPPPSLEAFEQVRDTQVRNLASPKKDRPLLTKRHILWSGCKADQTSADAFFSNRANGAFTYNYLKIVREANNGLTRAQVRDRLRRELKKQKFTQTPQLETNATNRNGKAG